MSKKYLLKAHVTNIEGNISKGHFAIELTEKEIDYFNNLSQEAQEEYLKENANFTVDFFSPDYYGPVTTIQIDEIKPRELIGKPYPEPGRVRPKPKPTEASEVPPKQKKTKATKPSKDLKGVL